MYSTSMAEPTEMVRTATCSNSFTIMQTDAAAEIITDRIAAVWNQCTVVRPAGSHTSPFVT